MPHVSLQSNKKAQLPLFPRGRRIKAAACPRRLPQIYDLIYLHAISFCCFGVGSSSAPEAELHICRREAEGAGPGFRLFTFFFRLPAVNQASKTRLVGLCPFDTPLWTSSATNIANIPPLPTVFRHVFRLFLPPPQLYLTEPLEENYPKAPRAEFSVLFGGSVEDSPCPTPPFSSHSLPFIPSPNRKIQMSSWKSRSTLGGHAVPERPGQLPVSESPISFVHLAGESKAATCETSSSRRGCR